MKLKNWQKNILSAFVIMLGGFVLFNAAFLLSALIINTLQKIMGMPQNTAPSIFSRAFCLTLIFIISWFVLKSKLNTLVKATYLTLPLMVVLVMIGLLLYQQPKFFITAIGTLAVGMLFLYLYKKKLSWQYYFATLYVAVLGLCIILFHIEI
ncbi:MAG TPA: hypothetical protein VHP31_10285 [Caproicibacter sp.]|nr:hypothetical protein [Caproicibacter sp.]